MLERDTISLQHVVRRHGNQMVFFYDGALEAVNGLLTLPAENLDWIKRAWISGYRITPDGRTLMEWPEILAEIERQSSKTADSTMSAEDKSVKDSSAGRQSTTGNGIRKDEQNSGKSVSTRRARSARSGSVDGGEEEAKVE